MENNIPNFQAIMLPFLKILSGGRIYYTSELYEALGREFNLSHEKREMLLPSGTQSIFNNRVSWAATYLKKAGLIFSPQRASFEITDAGIQLLKGNPEKIDLDHLKTLPDFKEWYQTYKIAYSIDLPGIESYFGIKTDEKTPLELIEAGYQQMSQSLSFDLIEEIKSISDKQFERLVLKVLTAMGYGEFSEGAAEHIGKPNDGGIDGLIKEDKLGLDIIYIQAKKYTDTVPIAHIRDFAGSLLFKKAKKGVFITLSTFPQSAIEFVNSIEPKIALIDGKKLTEFMIDYNVGVSVKRAIEFKEPDSDFFYEL